MTDKSINPMPPEGRDLIAHALYLGSAITDTASEPAEVITNAKPIAAWLAGGETDGADGDDDDLDLRLTAIYQQLQNQRGIGCEVNLFVERAELLYRFLAASPPAARSDVDPDVS
ncbi:MAG TPA: hypothetical protein VH912_14760 [Streptosporangiaceae bacterium]